MTTHITPGPWHDDNDREYTSRRVIRHNGVIVAVISEPTAGLSVDEVAGNAAAIAALPEALHALAHALPLLVLLGDFIGNAEDRCETIIMVKDALQHATGDDWGVCTCEKTRGVE